MQWLHAVTLNIVPMDLRIVQHSNARFCHEVRGRAENRALRPVRDEESHELVRDDNLRWLEHVFFHQFVAISVVAGTPGRTPIGMVVETSI